MGHGDFLHGPWKTHPPNLGLASGWPSILSGRNRTTEVRKILFLSKWVICRFHVNLPACRISFYERLHPYTLRSGGWPSIPGEGLGHEFLRHLERTKVTWVQPICWFLLIDVGMEFYLGIYIFVISWKLKLISIFFFEKISHFFQMSFFCCLPIFKKMHFVVFCHKSQIQVPRDPRNLHLPPNPREGSVTSEVLIYLVDCASSPDPYVDFLILQREVQAYFVPFWILKGKVDGWLLTKKPLVNFVKKKSKKYGDRDSDLNLRFPASIFATCHFAATKSESFTPKNWDSKDLTFFEAFSFEMAFKPCAVVATKCDLKPEDTLPKVEAWAEKIDRWAAGYSFQGNPRNP